MIRDGLRYKINSIDQIVHEWEEYGSKSDCKSVKKTGKKVNKKA